MKDVCKCGHEKIWHSAFTDICRVPSCPCICFNLPSKAVKEKDGDNWEKVGKCVARLKRRYFLDKKGSPYPERQLVRLIDRDRKLKAGKCSLLGRSRLGGNKGSPCSQTDPR